MGGAPLAARGEIGVVADVHGFFEPLVREYRTKLGRRFSDIQGFFEPLVREYRTYRKLERRFNRETAARFNLVGVWEPLEKELSRILATLLDPNGSHGQGGLYLEEFIRVLREHAWAREARSESGWVRDLLDEEALWFDEAAVRREETVIGARRIDIYIEVPRGAQSRVVIGIENKPWVGEQEAQISDYVQGLRGRCGRVGGLGPILLYLTGDGREPTTWSDRDRHHVLCVSYPGFIRSWTERSMMRTRPDKLRGFLRDFSSWIEEKFRADDGEEV